MDVYYDPNEHIDMNPIKSCQASSNTSLEYQQGVNWLQMACTASKMAKKGQKMLKCKNFKIIANRGRAEKIHAKKSESQYGNLGKPGGVLIFQEILNNK